MVFENATQYPTREDHLPDCPTPTSAYGFSKLTGEVYCRAAHDEHGLPYTICRPFNCVGVGETRALGGREIPSGNVKLAMSHVVPDLVQKVLKGQDPLRILGSGDQVRCYTYGGDLARGIVTAMFHPAARNEDFNLSTATPTSVRELAEQIWRKIHGSKPLRFESDAPYPHDVQRRVPDVSKARRVLGFEATTTLDQTLDEVIPWIRREIAEGRL